MRWRWMSMLLLLAVGCAHQGPALESQAETETETEAVPEAEANAVSTVEPESEPESPPTGPAYLPVMREVRFGLQGPPGVQVALTLYIDGMAYGQISTTIPGADDPNALDSVYVPAVLRLQSVPPDDVQVQIRAVGTITDPSGAEIPVAHSVTSSFADVHDAAIEVSPDGQRITVIMAVG